MKKLHLREPSSDSVRARRSARQLAIEGSVAFAVAAALCVLALATNDTGEWSFGGAFASMTTLSHPGYLALIVFALVCGGRVIKRWLD